MASLVTRCKRRADLENDEHISDAEWKALIGEVYGDLYSEVALTGYRYFEYSTTVTATGATSYTEPTGHMSTTSIHRVVDDAGRLSDPLVELSPGEEQYYKGRTGNAIAYQLIDDQLVFYPNPSSGSYTWRYIPQPPDLGTYDDAGVVDVVMPDGEAFLLWGTAVLAKSKSESDVTLAMARLAEVRERLQVWSANRAMEGRRRVQGFDLNDGRLVPPGWDNP